MSRSLRDEEPFATLRAHPRRFGWGIPAVFALSLGAAFPFATSNLSLAIALQLGIQTVGLIWLYLPPARARWRVGAPPGVPGDGVTPPAPAPENPHEG